MPIRDRHEFGPGIIREVSKYLYKNPKSAFKEAVSNALDQQPKDDARVEIYTDVLAAVTEATFQSYNSSI